MVCTSKCEGLLRDCVSGSWFRGQKSIRRMSAGESFASEQVDIVHGGTEDRKQNLATASLKDAWKRGPGQPSPRLWRAAFAVSPACQPKPWRRLEVAGVARFERVKTRGYAPLLRSAHLRSRWSLRQSRSAGSPPLVSEMRPLQCWTRLLVLWTRVGGGGGSRTRVPGTFTCSFYRLSSSIEVRVSAAEEHAALLLVPC